MIEEALGYQAGSPLSQVTSLRHPPVLRLERHSQTAADRACQPRVRPLEPKLVGESKEAGARSRRVFSPLRLPPRAGIGFSGVPYACIVREVMGLPAAAATGPHWGRPMGERGRLVAQESGEILELRVALTADAYEELVAFYLDGLGLEPSQVWPENQGRALVLDLGRATLEVFDEQQAQTVDEIETGRRVSGKVRFAFQVPDLDDAVERLLSFGAMMVHPPVVTPWGDRNVRFEDPEGMQITLYEASEGS